MQTSRPPHASPEEYLAEEQHNAYHSEFYDGLMVPRAPASINHQRIVGNVHALLYQHLNCKEHDLLITTRLWIPRRQVYTYPDLVVVAGEPLLDEGTDDTLLNPLMIVEVLSEKTRNYDRGEKFISYRGIEGFREYLLIDEASVYVEHFTRTPEKHWLLVEHDDLLAVVVLASMPIELTLRDIYKRVVF